MPGATLGQALYALMELARLPDFDSTIRRFESSRPSQPIRPSEIGPVILAERPANGGLLRIGHQSPGSYFRHSHTETAGSLRQIFEKTPVFGRLRLETGPDLHCVAVRHWAEGETDRRRRQGSINA